MKNTTVPENIMSYILPLEPAVYGAVHRAVYLYLRDGILPEEGSLCPSAEVIFNLLRRNLDKIVARRRRAAERRALKAEKTVENQAETTTLSLAPPKEADKNDVERMRDTIRIIRKNIPGDKAEQDKVILLSLAQDFRGRYKSVTYDEQLNVTLTPDPKLWFTRQAPFQP